MTRIYRLKKKKEEEEKCEKKAEERSEEFVEVSQSIFLKNFIGM